MKTAKLYIVLLSALFCVSCTRGEDTPEEYPITKEGQSIKLNGVSNARELGGYHIGNNTVKRGLLIRSGHLAKATDEDLDRLKNVYHLSTVFDFRTKTEIALTPDRKVDGASNINLPCTFIDLSSLPFTFKTIEELMYNLIAYADDPAVVSLVQNIYNNILTDESSIISYQNFMDSIVVNATSDRAVLWHCTQGKDRVGIASTLILVALGADRKLIMDDFTLTREFYADLVKRLSAYIEAQSGVDEKKKKAQYDVVNTIISANPELYGKALDSLESVHGSLEAFLRDRIKVTDKEKEILRSRYLE